MTSEQRDLITTVALRSGHVSQVEPTYDGIRVTWSRDGLSETFDDITACYWAIARQGDRSIDLEHVRRIYRLSERQQFGRRRAARIGA